MISAENVLELRKKADEINTTFLNSMNTSQHIKECRTALFDASQHLLFLFNSNHFKSDIIPEQLSALVDICKLGIFLSAGAAQTRIACQKGNGWEKIYPDIITQEERMKCIEIYDCLTGYVKEHDSAYVPLVLERVPPSSGELQSMQKLYFEQCAAISSKKQADSQKLNLLLGRRR